MEMLSIIQKYGQFIIGSLFLLYFLETFSNAIEISNDVAIAASLTVALYIQSIGELLYFYKKYSRPRLQDYLRLGLFITVVLNFISLVNKADGNANINVITKIISLNDATLTLSMILIAFVSLDIAYIVMQSLKKRNPNKTSYKIKRKNFLFVLLIFSTILKAYMLVSGLSGFGTDVQDSSGLLSLVSRLSSIINPFSLILSAYVIFIEKEENKTFHWIFKLALIFQIILGLLSGMKQNTLTPILFVGIVYLFSGGKVPKKIIYIATFLVMFLYPINNAYRSVISNPQLNTGSHALNMVVAVNKVLTEPLLETLTEGGDSYAKRGAMFPFLEYSINAESEWHYYKYMTRYLTLPIVWLVPRAVWPDKPRADTGGVLYKQVVGYDATTSITPTSIGWAYLEGGVFFLVVIFFILGIVFEFVDRASHKKPMVILFYIIILRSAIKPEWDPYFFLASLMQFYLISWFFLKYIGVTQRDEIYEN